MNFKVILLLSVCLLVIPKLIFAHGSGHAEKQLVSPLIEEDAPLNDSIYSINGEEDTEFQNLEETPMGSPFSSIYTLGNDDTSLIDGHIKTSEPMKRFKEKTNSPEHDQHKTQHVEESLHKWVSPNAKGYTVAISMTILSGLTFMGLSFFRIGEKN
jgi:predicted esterase